jgi:predicted nucleic-acid-binding protein
VTGLDTNVLVRYVMQDDPRQSARATKLVESFTGEQPGFVPLVAVLELVWVLSGSYGLARNQVAAALESLLRSKELVVHRADLVAQALSRYRSAGADFADALLERIAVDAGCPTTLTFDVGAAKAAGMTLVP